MSETTPFTRSLTPFVSRIIGDLESLTDNLEQFGDDDRLAEVSAPALELLEALVDLDVDDRVRLDRAMGGAHVQA